MTLIDDYFPFVIGPWRGELDCPRHGMQDGGLVVQIRPRRGGKVITRRYCGSCVLVVLGNATADDGGGA
jgi:hypothetical protein